MFQTLQQNINDELVNVSIWFTVNKLSINFNKIEFMVVTTKQNKPELKVSIDNNPIISRKVPGCSHRRQSKLETTNQGTMFKGSKGIVRH